MARCNSLIRFIDFTVFCGAVEATDSTIISRQTSTVPCSGTRPLSPPLSRTLALALRHDKPVGRGLRALLQQLENTLVQYTGHPVNLAL